MLYDNNNFLQDNENEACVASFSFEEDGQVVEVVEEVAEEIVEEVIEEVIEAEVAEEIVEEVIEEVIEEEVISFCGDAIVDGEL